ncbi:hypothetical protein APHMUC_0158 [Anaplasma phagocytophilum str. ApMUC09]|uniref:Uncharacterized protein n=1 Tax=Anaplasma phagocytophilum str. ApMUC09 TaxID=1359152 RepID=A0A0F3NCX9_ANAPH|nr:hypothetical protein APHMUC_0158 [Anaplasma phagocytophilum str. ApMUC09]SCV65686.1 hypothetical protein ANAPH2_01346 [Anaplasma phagocytophilum]
MGMHCLVLLFFSLHSSGALTETSLFYGSILDQSFQLLSHKLQAKIMQ